VIGEVLKRMESTPLGRLDVTAARQVAQREGGKAVVTGEIRPLGSGYVLLANMVSSVNAEVLASVRETAADEGQIIEALDRLSAALRDRIGEPLKAIRASPSLVRVTTPSLEALRKFTQAETLRDGGDELGALSLLEEAVNADSAFAMAHRTIGIVVGNLGLSPRRNLTARRRAFQHRDRLTERERLLAMGTYYYGVTGELDEARTAYEAAVEAYPDEFRAWQNLGSVFRAQHQPLRAESCYIRAFRLGSSAISLVNLIQVQVALGKFADAKVTLESLADRFPNATARSLRQQAVLAYGQRDYASAVSALQALTQVSDPLARARAFAHLQAISTNEGKLAEAARYRSQALEHFTQADAARDYLVATASGASISVSVGQSVEDAASQVAGALRRFELGKLDPLARPYLDIALFYALTDRTDEARQLLREWAQTVEFELRRRVDPQRRVVEGAISLSEGRFSDAILELRSALVGEPALYAKVVLPLLGRAYEASDQADSAIAAYERFLGETEVGFGPTATSLLASAHYPDAAWRADTHARLGKLNEQKGSRESAIHNYNLFVDLWSDADPELLPRVENVRRRIAQLIGEVQQSGEMDIHDL
jgi:tetratricopeptide (TPR) repeat protein